MRNKNLDIGLLLVRVGMGIIFLFHGFPKITGGVEYWDGLGKAMGFIGIHVFPAFWGFMAAVAEFGGGLCLIFGIFFRTAMGMMFFTMFMATIFHLGSGDGFSIYAHALEDAILFLALLFTGPGIYSLQQKLPEKFRNI